MVRKKYFVLGWLDQLRPAWRTQQTNQARTPFICTLWVPIRLSFHKLAGATSSLSQNFYSIQCWLRHNLKLCSNLSSPISFYVGCFITLYCLAISRPHVGCCRLLYCLAISRPRFRSVEGKPLPSPRLVSIVVHADVSHLHSRYTLALMQENSCLQL